MGYYTDYRLTIDPEPSEELIEKLSSDKYTGSYIGYFDHYDGAFTQHGKWYDHELDMLSLSKQYPSFVFTLEGDGEERGDLWVKYFKDGQFYSVDLTVEVPPFHESLLSRGS